MHRVHSTFDGLDAWWWPKGQKREFAPIRT